MGDEDDEVIDQVGLMPYDPRIRMLVDNGPICLFPGIETRGTRDDAETFWDCLPNIGKCNVLIFCELSRTQRETRDYVESQRGKERYGIKISDVTWEKCGEVADLFPCYKEPPPDWVPVGTKPTEDRFWAEWSKLEIAFAGQETKTIDLVHLGIGGHAVWLYFLIPHALNVARIITDPNGGTPGAGGIWNPDDADPGPNGHSSP